jgi:hypothetical protein
MEYTTSLSLLASLLLAGVAIMVLKSSKRRLQNGPYAPGPTPKPIIGNLFDIPSKRAARVFVEWGKKYNSAYQVSFSSV